MKHSKAPLFFFLLILCTSGIAQAREMALGVAADQNLTFSTTSLTGLIGLDPVNKIQGFFSIDDTNPFNVNFAGLFKHTVVESQNIGLHVGGGLGLGAANSPTKAGNGFAFSLTGIAGVHFSIPSLSHLAIHLDAGPVFQSVDSTSDFHIGALSSALGLSVFYVF